MYVCVFRDGHVVHNKNHLLLVTFVFELMLISVVSDYLLYVTLSRQTIALGITYIPHRQARHTNKYNFTVLVH